MLPVLRSAAWMIGALAASAVSADGTGPRTPEGEQATFVVAPGYRVDLVASEPGVVDPVAMTFDERGRLFVVEMSGYPNGGLGDGKPNFPGKIKMLEDKDGDGRFETSTVYAEGLRFPTGVCYSRGGLLVADAPDLLYLKDTDGDGKADVRRVLYTGFGTRNIQQLLNGLQFHFDNWIHGCNGANESTVTSRELSDARPLPLRGRHFKLHPDQPGSMEPTSGGGQYGLASDNWGNWFTCTNSQHLRQVVLQDEYLRANPTVLVRTTTVDIPDGVDGHIAAARLYRVSNFEAWRVERTTRRSNDPDMRKRLPPTELSPGGYTTSATGIVVDRGGVFVGPYAGCTFAGDPANNLIHADRLAGPGPEFVGCRVEPQREFLASTDGWFRPVFLTGGPDGCIYVCDFYREVIETPLSLPDDIKATLNLNTRGRGRIWRIAPRDFRSPKLLRLDQIPSFELVATLAHPNGWSRLTAQRLLIERNAKDVQTVRHLRELADRESAPLGRLHALWTLAGLGELNAALLQRAFVAAEPGLRANAIRIAEEIAASAPISSKTALQLACDPSPLVRFQLGLTLSKIRKLDLLQPLERLCETAHSNVWLSTAALMAAQEHSVELFERAARSATVSSEFVERLAQQAARYMDARQRQAMIDDVARKTNLEPAQQYRLAKAVFASFSKGAKSTTSAGTIGALFESAQRSTGQSKKPEERLAAIDLLAFGPPSVAIGSLEPLLEARHPAEIQQAAIRSLAKISDAKVAALLIDRWKNLLPAARREIQEALFNRVDRVRVLLQAMSDGRILPGDLEAARREQLLAHRDPSIRAQARTILAKVATPDRQKIIDDYRAIAALSGDPKRGMKVFEKNCTTCHRLGNVGKEVGPDLHAALKNKTRDTLLVDILDPSREVDSRYINYVVSMADGRVATGLIAGESASAIVLHRADRVEDVLPRTDLESVQSTNKSLMPDGLEKEIGKQAMADLIAFLLSQR